MWGWILAALIGAVPLYFGFAFGRMRTGIQLLTGFGVLLSLSVLGLMVATNTGIPTLVLAGLGIAYLAGVGVLGTMAGALVALVMGVPGDGAGR